MEYELEDASLFSIRGNAMDRAVELGVIQPLTIFNIVIGRVVADDKNEGGAWVTMVFYDITHTPLNVALQLLARGVTVAPLRRIAVSSHLSTSVGKNSQKGINVGICGRADGHGDYNWIFCKVITVISGGTPIRTGRVQPSPVLMWRDWSAI